MTSILLWYLVVQCVGAVGFALAFRICAALPDRGYCAAKTLGVLLVGVVLWLGTGLGLLSNGRGGALLALLGLLVLGVAWRGSAPRDGVLGWIREHRSLVIATEALFLAAFLGWCFVRAHDPAADHTEQPMDLMLLVAVSSSETFPPADPWLSGHPISYYYLGYWLIGTLGHLAGTPPELTYNLAQATWFALLLLGGFGLAFDLTSLVLGKDAGGSRLPARAGLLAALAVGVTANVALPIEWAKRWLAGTASTLWSENWWWWRSSRVVHDQGLDGEAVEVITEFPFFSYLLGDNHPHVLAMPVTLATMMLALAMLVAVAARSTGARLGGGGDPGVAPGAPRSWRRRVPGGAGGLVLLLGVAGSIAAINTWDVAGVWSILIVVTAAVVARFAHRPVRAGVGGAVLAVATIGAATAALYLPYHLTSSSQVRGLLPNLLHPTPLTQSLVMFATLVPGVALLIVEGWGSGARAGRAVRYGLLLLGLAAAWLAVAAILVASGVFWTDWPGAPAGQPRGDLVRLALGRWLVGWPTLVLAIAAVATVLESLRARWSQVTGPSELALAFALLLAGGGAALAAVPELLYLRDSFGTRMNTVFKFYYQAWPMLAIAGAVGITLRWRRGGRARLAAILGAVALLPGLSYPVLGLWSKTNGFSTPPTLDALAWLERWRPDELAAIRWVGQATARDAVVVQRSGASYHPEHNLVSMVTGRPTLLGWGGHEYQWRGGDFERLAAGREEALGRIYGPRSAGELAGDLATWNVEYVYLGPEERARYEVTAAQEETLAAATDLVFENGAVRIYRRRR